MLKIDCASMIGHFLHQLIDHNFGWRVPTLLWDYHALLMKYCGYGMQWTAIISISIQTFIALNLHLLTDSKALDPSCIQSHSPLTICLIAVGGNRSARRKPTLKSRSGTIPCIPVMAYWWNPHTYIAMIYQWNSSPVNY